MNASSAYTQEQGKSIEDPRFEHVMALALDANAAYKRGLIRCITSREGDLQVKGYLDRSRLFKVEGNPAGHFAITEPLTIAGEHEVVSDLMSRGEWDFIGLEDPDIWTDEAAGMTHVYFTMPFIPRGDAMHGAAINLGHAVGKGLDTLVMTEPVLRSHYMSGKGEGAKEVSIVPRNRQGVRLNLVESSDGRGSGHKYSTICIAIAEDMGRPWEYGDTVFHPAQERIVWAGGHASPGPFFSKNFIDVGEHKLLGIMNGREADRLADGEVRYGIFSVGLFIYDYEQGEIEWVSPKPFIRDTQSRSITFASQVVEHDNGTATLYAHVDDSFVRAYTIYADKLAALIN